MSEVSVTHAPERQRYEAHIDGRLAGLAAYVEKGDAVVFTHTEVGDDFEGRGVGSALARWALDDVRASGRSVVPRCPFIKGWIDKHPDYADLVQSRA